MKKNTPPPDIQPLSAVVIGLHRMGATNDHICELFLMWPGEVEKILNDYFKDKPFFRNFSNN